MVESWVILSVAAAFFQNLRSALQKHLKGKLSNVGAAYSRFLYALPFSIIYLFAVRLITKNELPQLNLTFFMYALAGSIAQILFTVLLLWMFSFKSFAVGTTFSKLEIVIIALLGTLILQDELNSIAIIAILICATGVVALTAGQTGLRLRNIASTLISRETTTGLSCAFFLGASVVCFRGASLSLQSDSFIMSAATTLAVTLIVQTLLMGLWIVWREPDQLRALVREWRWASIVGAAGVLTSIGWFTAFTLQNASYVRAVGTIELLFTYLFSTRIFREKVTGLEITGMLLVVAGIILLLGTR